MEKQLEQEKKEEKESSDKLFTQFKDDNIRAKVKTQVSPKLNEIVALFSPAVAPLVVDAVIDYLKEKNDVLKLEFKYNQMNEFVIKTLKASTDKQKSELEEAIVELQELLETTRSQSPAYQEKLKPQMDLWEAELEAKESELQRLLDQEAGRAAPDTYLEYEGNGIPPEMMRRQQSQNQEIV
jgi:vacuolar-type H+-ATPase subunit I/STV1